MGSGLDDFVDMATALPYSSHCGLFQFVLSALVTGLFCMLGFAGNTLSFLVFWKDKSASASGFLLQAVLIGDMAVLWMLFIGDVIPALGYAVPVLRECSVVCGYVWAVTQPLLFLGQVCVIWFTLLAAINRYVVMCKPSESSACCTVESARRQAIVTTVGAALLTLPLTFDSSVTLPTGGGANYTETLADNYWYRMLYHNTLVLFLVYVIPLACVLYLAVKLMVALQSVKRLRRALASTHKVQNTDLAQVLLLLCICLLLCYVPTTALRVLEWADGEVRRHCGHLQYYLHCFSLMFLALNSAIKLLIFALFSKKFRAGMRETFYIRPSSASRKPRSASMMTGMSYKCADMSEMTLISHVDNRI